MIITIQKEILAQINRNLRKKKELYLLLFYAYLHACAGVYSEPFQTSKMKFGNHSILDVWSGSKYTSAVYSII